MMSERKKIPDLIILKVFEKMRRASLIYLETQLKDKIGEAKNGNGESDREFLKKELERLHKDKLIGEIEAHSDALKAYYLTGDGLEAYCRLSKEAAAENMVSAAG